MEILPATERDIPLIQQLAEKSWRAAYGEILSAEQIDYMLGAMYSEKEISSQLQNPDYHYFILNKNIPVGFIGFENHYENETTKLHRIYLLPEEKGKGYGKIAMDFIKKYSKNVGDKRLILNVNKNNPAKKMYEKQGFSVYEEAVIDIGSGFVMDDFLMEILL